MGTIDRIAVIGAGIMGHGIAQVCAQGGIKVVLVDAVQQALNNAKTRIISNVELLLANGLVTGITAEDVIGRIEFATSIEKASDADMIIEAIPEKIALKESLFKNLERVCRPDAILATNTSGIPITRIAEMTCSPERVIGTHFYMPAQLIPLVEVIETNKTADEVVKKTVAVLTAVGKKPVRVRKDIPGFIGNRLQHALAREAMSLVEKGVATPEDIDTVVKDSLAIRLVFTGPMEQRDLNGLDTHLSIAEYLYADLENTTKPLNILRAKVEGGEIGLKAGKGFYDWTDRSAQEVINRKNQDLIDLLKFLKIKGQLG